jgi:D-alanyl-D-alanine-carboxypeptidase/D-alanyl-D-alanine-endopeptidase
MKKIRKTLAMMATLLLSLPLSSQAAPLPESSAALEQRLAARFEGDRTGSCVLAALIDKGQVRRARYCAGGRSDGPPDMGAAFEIGSVSKTMTAALVADLIERGQWSLDDPIAKHLPAGTPLPRQGERQILVRDLLTHSAGLPVLPPGMRSPDPANPYAALSEAELLASLADVKLTGPIGSQSAYSNFGMMLVSLAVARSDGGELEAALRERVFKPLGMSGAYITKPTQAAPAQGHLPTGQATAAWTIASNLAGVGMVKASLADMERYARAELGEGPSSLVTVLRRTQQPLAHGFAMNWMLRSMQGHEIVMHEGGTGGFSYLVALDPATQRAVVLLADTALSDLGGLGDLGLSLLGVDLPVQAPRRAMAAPVVLRHSLAGEYDLGGLPMRIWEQAESGRLMAQAQGHASFELLYDSQGDFYPTSFSALLRPVPQTDAAQPLARFAWRLGGGMVEARRLGLVEAAPSASNPAWRDWAGEYQIVPQFSLRVFERDGQLMLQGTGQPAVAVEVTGKDRIEVKAVGAVVEFERDAAGHVLAAVLRQNGQILRGPRR